MRTKLLSFLMLLTVAVNYGQITTSPAGIAIQGIARDNNNTAKTSANINLLCTIYEQGSLNSPIFVVRKTVTTDAFGVFSIILEPGAANNVVIANKDAFLQIADESTGTSIIISDEKLKQVPYAIAASNGVPTGSIMPFIGTTAPAGWVMCDGSLLPTNGSEKALQELLGGSAIKNAPDLRGMFLRAAGQNNNTTNAAEIQPNTLKAVQSSDNKSHNHTMNEAGEHSHIYSAHTTVGNNADGGSDISAADNPSYRNNLTTSTSGKHTHVINNSGGTESRPINYGVNYIIKL